MSEVPDLLDNVLLDPNGWAIVLESWNTNLPEGMALTARNFFRNDDGSHMFGPGTKYPYVKAIVSGFYVECNGHYRESIYPVPGENVIGITFYSPENTKFLIHIEHIVANTKDQLPISFAPIDLPCQDCTPEHP